VKSVLYIWELGANLGHVGSFLPTLKRFQGDGIHVTAAACRLLDAAPLLNPAGVFCAQAPFFPDPLRNSAHHRPDSFADIMLACGFGSPQTLRIMVDNWTWLMKAQNPDLVLIDYGPTALVGARVLGLPVAHYSTGFYVPPPGHPLPSLDPSRRVPEAVLKQASDQVLHSVNAVLEAFHRPPVEEIGDLYRDVALPGLFTLREVDHFGPREAHYWGPMTDGEISNAVEPIWPQGRGKRVYAYLRQGVASARPVLDALYRNGCPTLVFAPDFPDQWYQHLSRYPNIRISKRPYNLRQVLATADRGICYGSHAVTLAFALAGKPVLVCPIYLEQRLLGEKLQEAGIGILLPSNTSPGDTAKTLDEILATFIGDAELERGAQAFAARHLDASQAQVLDRFFSGLRPFLQP